MGDFWGNAETVRDRTIASGAARAAAPSWIDRAPYAAPTTPNPHFVAHGVCVLLDEQQIDLCGAERAWYYRRADLVTAPAGAERAAQFSVSYDPAFQRLEVHSICVIRGATRIEHVDTAPFEVLRREQNLERLMFDGRLTVHMTLPDVRAGDIVETSYTIYGMRKSYGGRHGAWVPIQWGVGICDVRVRLRTPSNRQVDVYGVNDAPAPVVKEENGILDRTWRTWERPGVRFEALTPPWLIENSALQFSEWKSWRDVVATFAPLYEETAPLPAAIEAEIARIAAAESTPAGRAAAVLRFTQAGIRYLAISIGEGGHTPRKIDDICTTRYGDCKDKAKLFVSMAQRLGLDACPALVNTTNGYALDTWLPCGAVFDHCIVRLALDGRVYWLDGTRSVQQSPLNTLGQCHYGFALPLRDGVTALERMPDLEPIQVVQVQEKVALGAKIDEPVRYEWRITSRRGRAEAIREQFTREGEVGLFKLYAEDIQRVYPHATPVEQKIADDIERNEITVTEVYSIRDAWTAHGQTSYAFSTSDAVMRRTLQPLALGERKHPIFLGAVGDMVRNIVVEGARDLPHGGWTRDVICPSASFKTEMRRENNRRIVVDQKLSIRNWVMPLEEAEKYRSIVAELERNDLSITSPVDGKGQFKSGRGGGRTSGGGGISWRLIWLGIVILSAIARYFAGNH